MTTQEPEARRPPPTAVQIRAAFLAFSDMIRRLDAQDELIPRIPLLLGRLGDLRHMIFEYEVRVTERLLPSPEEES